jgi:hypothetical protein
MTQAIPQVEEKAFLRQEEKDKYLSIILERKSFLVVADAGSGSVHTPTSDFFATRLASFASTTWLK